MAYGGFGKNSGPSEQAGSRTAFGNFPRHPSPSSPLPIPPRYVLNVRVRACFFISSFPIRNVSWIYELHLFIGTEI